MQINAATMNGCTYNLNGLAGTVRTAALNNIWYNCAEDGNAYPLTLTGGIGNICYSQWSAGNPRIVINKGGVFSSDLGWGINVSATTAATTPGNVVKKVPVWDEAGNVLGYVPIYDGIT
ncbi:MAG: hypothetical protein IPO35_17760 [Uliginosibacterium sp.]|nr:hypothetical protein [Uliginosibacterium sp.]